MAKSYHQKMKLLYLMKLFWEETDEQHVVSMKEMIEYLEKKKLRAERKSIYDDIEALKAFGMDIKNRREKPAGYYLERLRNWCKKLHHYAVDGMNLDQRDRCMLLTG